MRKLLFLIVLLTVVSLDVSAQFKTRIYNIHYARPFAQTVGYDSSSFSTTDLSFGGNVCVGNKYLHTIIEYNYHKMNLSRVSNSPLDYIHIHELLFGLRYYNARPTFLIGNAAFRLTLGLSGGFDLDLQTRSEYFGGFAITGIKQPSGILIQFFYHRSANPTQGYQIKPYYGLRLGIVIGPSTNL